MAGNGNMHDTVEGFKELINQAIHNVDAPNMGGNENTGYADRIFGRRVDRLSRSLTDFANQEKNNIKNRKDISDEAKIEEIQNSI